MSAIQQLLIDHIDIWTAAETEKKSGRGRSSSNAASIYGTKKLRELILDLAARGKLVPQDANDEPVAELLKRISHERNRKLEYEGLRTIAKDDIKKSEMYVAIPDSWRYCRLGNLARFIDYRGKTPDKIDSGVPLITAKNVRFGYISNEPNEFISEEDYASWMTRGFPKVGDILFTTEAPLGNVALVNTTEKFALAQRVICFQLHEIAIGGYLKIAMMSKPLQKELKNAATGMTATGIKASKLKEIPIPIPPIQEQNRIVAKVDELMALCDQLESQHSDAAEAHEQLVSHLLGTLTRSQNEADFSANWVRIAAHFDTLFTTEASIDALKQAVLQLAVMGRLVAQDTNEEPAGELLKRIEIAAAKLIAEGRIKKPKLLGRVSDNQIPYELPGGWEWTTLSSIALINPRNSADDSLPVSFVSMTMIETKYDSTHSQEHRLWKEVKQGFTHFAEGDIGVAKITPCFENSKACVFSGLLNQIGAGTTELHVIRPINSTLSPRYILAYLKSPQFLLNGESKMTGTAGQKRLPKEFVESNPFPLPPLAEQHRIVAKIDEIIKICDNLKSRIKDANYQQTKVADVLVEYTAKG